MSVRYDHIIPYLISMYQRLLRGTRTDTTITKTADGVRARVITRRCRDSAQSIAMRLLFHEMRGNLFARS